MPNPQAQRFHKEIAPHLSGAFNLARWLTGNDADADEVVQESCVRAFRFIETLLSENPKAWFFQIVRNSAFTLLRAKRNHENLDDESDRLEAQDPGAEAALVKRVDAEQLRNAMEQLPAQYREILILREWEELSYQEIAFIASIPEGTVMSRISRAKQQLKETLTRSREGGPHGFRSK